VDLFLVVILEIEMHGEEYYGLSHKDLLIVEILDHP
jgi:hypothetical protein